MFIPIVGWLKLVIYLSQNYCTGLIHCDLCQERNTLLWNISFVTVMHPWAHFKVTVELKYYINYHIIMFPCWFTIPLFPWFPQNPHARGNEETCWKSHYYVILNIPIGNIQRTGIAIVGEIKLIKYKLYFIFMNLVEQVCGNEEGT